MKQIILATGADYTYYQKSIFQNYLQSIIENSNFDKNYIILLDVEADKQSEQNIQYTTIQSTQIKCLNQNKCIQHGEFLKAEGLSGIDGSDIVIFTDADMTIQRGLTSTEKDFLQNLGDSDVFVGYNASPTDTLQDELHRLNFTGYQGPSISGDFGTIKVYNTGVLCMNKTTWTKLTSIYIELFPEVDRMFEHYAKQQWLLSYIIGTREFSIYEMPYDFHNHTHYPSPVGTTINEQGVVHYQGSVALFKHKWF